MTRADLEKRANAGRFNICGKCRRPVEERVVKLTSKGVAIDVACHGDRQTGLFAPSEIEGCGQLFWFTDYDRALVAAAIPPRIDVHLHIHHVHHDSTKEESQ